MMKFLLVIVVVSYRQTIYAYPSGGGSYVVSRENLGETPSLVAGAALLTDYILTVAVSIAGGVLAIQSAFGFGSQWRVPLGLALVAVMTVANLRGLRESGSLFAPPTYLYIVMLMVAIVVLPLIALGPQKFARFIPESWANVLQYGYYPVLGLALVVIVTVL